MGDSRLRAETGEIGRWIRRKETGVSDATNNLNAVLKALSNKATNFPVINGLYMCAFALDCETPGQGFPTFNFADYLAGCSRWQPASRIRWAIN